MIILAFGLSLINCSAYQSEGREFLEEQAFDFAFAGQAVAAVQIAPPCAELKDSPSHFIEESAQWLEARDNTDFFRTNSSEGLQLIAYQATSDRHFVCQKSELNESTFLQNYQSNLVQFQLVITELIANP